MRSFISTITLGLIFAACQNGKVEAGFWKNEVERKVTHVTLKQSDTGYEETTKYSTGSFRISSGIEREPNDIVQSKIVHHDGTITYTVSGINFKDIPVPHVRAWLKKANELNKAKAGGFKEYAESRYGPHLRPWAKRAKALRVAESKSWANYMESRYRVRPFSMLDELDTDSSTLGRESDNEDCDESQWIKDGLMGKYFKEESGL